ncbi:MAG: zf-HC2 domain-containing protein [Gemmatimonadota bacterium]
MNEFEVAAYLDRQLPSSDRERIERHLANCVDCRLEITETSHILARGRRQRLGFAGGILLATAAALLLVMRPVMVRAPEGPVSPPLRETADIAPLIGYGPSGEVTFRSLRFVWGSAPNATAYRLTVSAADGVPVWSASTLDTIVILPDSVRLQAGRRYFWLADALLDDGATRSTGLREFQPVP